MSPKMNLDALKQNLTNPQRTFMWEFEIPAPKGISASDVWTIRSQSIVEPGRSFAAIDIPYKGTGGLRVPGKEVYTHEIAVRVLESEDAATFKAIHSWMKMIRDNVSGVGEADPDLKTDAVVRLLTTKGVVAKMVKLVGMYPQAKPDVTLNYDENAVEGYDVTFAYDRWEEMS